MARERVERRLAAVLATDVAGYSRLMGLDEEGTLARLMSIRKALVDARIAFHRGRIVKTTGDGMLVEFASAVDAVRCSIEVQHGMATRNTHIPQESRIEFKIGIHVGDIIIDDNDIFGDGVNIAARLEGIAEPGGICISDDAQRQVRGKVDMVFDDMGSQALKNISEPMRVWRVKLGGQGAATAQQGSSRGHAAALVLPDKPSIAVLPFQNMSGDPAQEYFADGITEDIITELSRFSELFVIARNSSFQYKSKAVDLRQVGRELGVRYVLEGSVRPGSDRVRITAQLIDSETGGHRWAERYDRELNDVFAIQDEVARTIASILAAHLNKAEIERTLLKPPAVWQAHDYYMRAADAWGAFLSSWQPSDFTAARGWLEKSVSSDSKYARAYTMLASTYRVAWFNPLDAGYLRPESLEKAIQLARKAIELAPNLPEAYAELGYDIARKGEYDAAVAAVERAISLNPNFADYRVVAVFVFAGQHARAIDLGKAHIRRDPFHSHWAPSGWDVPVICSNNTKRRNGGSVKARPERRTFSMGISI